MAFSEVQVQALAGKLSAKHVRTRQANGRTLSYIEGYRQPLGFDAFIPLSGPAIADNVFNGLAISLGSESSGNSSNMLDMTPGTLSPDHSDAALQVGQSYSDPGAGVTITTDWTDAFGAQVSVSFGPATCARANPQISLTPSESLWVEPGTPVTYTVIVTNRDSAECTSRASSEKKLDLSERSLFAA